MCWNQWKFNKFGESPLTDDQFIEQPRNYDCDGSKKSILSIKIKLKMLLNVSRTHFVSNGILFAAQQFSSKLILLTERSAKTLKFVAGFFQTISGIVPAIVKYSSSFPNCFL